MNDKNYKALAEALNEEFFSNQVFQNLEDKHKAEAPDRAYYDWLLDQENGEAIIAMYSLVGDVTKFMVMEGDHNMTEQEAMKFIYSKNPKDLVTASAEEF